MQQSLQKPIGPAAHHDQAKKPQWPELHPPHAASHEVCSVKLIVANDSLHSCSDEPICICPMFHTSTCILIQINLQIFSRAS